MMGTYGTPGGTRRARKKRQTRERLLEAAIRLFAENGYERTTVATIAAAADVATKTFFNHFHGKEDLLFVDAEHYSAMMVEIIAAPRPGETVAELLVRAYEEVTAQHEADISKSERAEFADVYATTLATVPAVQAKALHVMFTQERVLANALHRTYPDRLDEVSAAAAVGSLIGAVRAAGLLPLGGADGENFREDVARRCIGVAVSGLRSL